MASTNTLLSSLNFCSPFVQFKPLTIGAGNEPAISAGNIIKQTILGPPFAWRWNRNTFTFTTVAGQQDYSFKNWLSYSQTLANAAWNKFTGVTVTDAFATGPTGVANTASRVQYDGSGTIGSFRLVQNVSQLVPAIPASGTQVAVSVYLKANAGTPSVVIFDNFNNPGVTCALTANWQRFTLIGPANGQNLPSINLYSPVGVNTAFDILLYGAQVELSGVVGPNIQSTGNATAALIDFGYIEKASVQTTVSPIAQVELIIDNTLLGQGNEQSRPRTLSPVLDDNSGNITFRFLPVPDAAYSVTITYQKKAALFAGTGDTWASIPDEYSYIYNRGMLALMLEYSNDPRGAVENAKFVGALLGASEGLSDTAKNIFLNSWLVSTRQEQAVNIKTQQGYQARGQ